MNRISVDVVSDVVCPWCYLGKARLDKAIELVGDELGVDVTFRPYQLNPDHPPEGVDHQKHLAAKLGGKDAMDRGHAMLKGLGAQDGIAFDFDAIKIGPNTLNAHRLILWALQEGKDVHDLVTTLLFKANFEQGRNIGDKAVLVDIAGQAGMDREAISRLLDTDADVDTVKGEINQAQRMGVSGVPFFIIDGKYGISGAQSVEVLAGALKDIASKQADSAAG